MAVSTIDADVLRSYWEVVEAAAPTTERKTGRYLGRSSARGDNDAAAGLQGVQPSLCADGAGEGPADMFYFEQALAVATTSHNLGSSGGPEPSTVQSVGSSTATETVPSLTRLVVEEQKTLDHFHKLKFNWLELRTKQYFLEALLGCPEGVPPNEVCPSDAEIAELEISSAQAKQELKKIKDQTRSLQEQMEALCAELARAHEVYIESFDLCRTAVDDLCARVEERQCRERLDAQEASLASLRQQETELAATVAKLEWEIRPLEESTETLRRNVAAAEERLAAQELSNEIDEGASRQQRVQHMAEWYRAMTQLLESISGIRIQHFGADHLIVDVENVFTEVSTQVTLYFAPGTCLLSRFELNPAPRPESLLDVSSQEKIIRIANSTGDIGWLIRTLQARLS
ncbi:hypothetical protein CCYA_CCYA13G3495 [Cyanidiococcus yangmingshanensis]|nr:hypothetical protein CCYA_CCYA13G3495 [Cyanidiococcus yangmingshanensis]